MKKLLSFGVSATLLGFAVMARPAETVHLFLKANGVDVQGESPITSLGRQNSIQCLSYEQKVATAREAASGMATGRRQYEPILIRKRIDKSSPLLAKSLVNNEVIDAVFRFYRPGADGTTQHFFTVEFKGGRISSQRLFILDTLTPATAQMPPLEEVSFVFPSIKYRYELTGAEFEDRAGVNRVGTLVPLRTPPPLLLFLAPEVAGIF